MNVREEIKAYANDEDVLVLHWLFDRYHWQRQWMFVAKCEHVSTGTKSYQSVRRWYPTKEGRRLYAFQEALEALKEEHERYVDLGYDTNRGNHSSHLCDTCKLIKKLEEVT